MLKPYYYNIIILFNAKYNLSSFILNTITVWFFSEFKDLFFLTNLTNL